MIKVVLLSGHSLLQFPVEIVLMTSLCGFKHEWEAHVEIIWQNLCRKRGTDTSFSVWSNQENCWSFKINPQSVWIRKNLLVKVRTGIFQVLLTWSVQVRE